MHQRTLLLLSIVAIVAIWQLPYGWQILYPLTLLATFAHEMGHGLTAMLVGAQFDQLLLNADGSGVAVWHGNPGRLATALVAAGGLVGPSIAGIGLLLVARSQRFARAVLAMLALLLMVSVVVWVRNAFGVVFLLSAAAVLALAAMVLPATMARFVLHLMAATLCLSWFTDLNYMFSAQATVNGMVRPSDSAVIAHALWLPYWFWGGVVACFSLVVAALGITFVSRDTGQKR